MTERPTERPKILLRSPHPWKERILVYGMGGAGKTTTVGSIASHVPDAKFHVLDTDISFAYQRMIHGEFPWTKDQFSIHEVNEWDDFTTAMADVIEHGDHDKDWLVVDNITWTWNEVQSWYSDQVHGVDIGQHFVELRKQANDAKEFAGLVAAEGNWQIINKVYRREVYNRLHRWHGNLIITAEAKATDNRDQDNPDTGIYAPYGLKPSGQNQLHYITHTTLLLAKTGRGKREVTTIKDRTRREVERVEYTDFALDYLRDIGGWVPYVAKAA